MPSPNANGLRDAFAKLKAIAACIVHDSPVDLKHAAQGATTNHRSRLQLRMVVGTFTDLTMFIKKLLGDEYLTRTKETIENAVLTFFLKCTYGEEAVAEVLGDRRHFSNKDELFVMFMKHWVLNEEFFDSYGLDILKLVENLRNCLEKPDEVFPGWMRSAGFQDSLWLYDGPWRNGKPAWSEIEGGEALRAEYELPEAAPPAADPAAEPEDDAEDEAQLEGEAEPEADAAVPAAAPNEEVNKRKRVAAHEDEEEKKKKKKKKKKEKMAEDGDDKTVIVIAKDDEGEGEEEVSNQRLEEGAHPGGSAPMSVADISNMSTEVVKFYEALRAGKAFEIINHLEAMHPNKDRRDLEEVATQSMYTLQLTNVKHDDGVCPHHDPDALDWAKNMIMDHPVLD